MFCPYCNSEINDGLKFCPKCGSPVASASYQQPEQQYQAPYQQQYQQPPVFNQPPVQPMQFYAEQPQEDNRVPGKGLGIASMVLGIIALAFTCFPWVGVPLGGLGFLFGVIAKIIAASKKKKNKQATAGLVCSILACLWLVAALVFGFGAAFFESM